MAVNTSDNAIIDLGVSVNSQQAQKEFDNIVKYIQDWLKHDFNIDIKANNINELRTQLNNLGGTINIIKNESTGMAEAIQVSLKTANGETIKLKAALEQLNGQYDIAADKDVTSKLTAGASQLEKIEQKLVQAMEARATASKNFDAQAIAAADRRVQSLKLEKQQAQELKNLYANISAGSGKQSVTQQRKDAAISGYDKDSPYNKYAADIENMSSALKEFQKIQTQAFSASTMDKSSAVYQDIQTNLEASKKSLETFVSEFNAAVQAVDSSAGKTTATFEEMSDSSVQLTSSYDGNNKALKEMSDLINKVGKNLKTAFAQQSDKITDTQKIEAAVKAYQKYRDAVLVVDKAKASGRTATQQERDAVNQAKAAYEQCEQAILSNGEAVKQNTTYNREKNQVTRNSIQALKEYESQLGSVNNSMAGSIAQMIQMKLGFEGLQESISKVYETAKDLNDSMTDIQLVTQQSDSDATDLMKSYAGLAQEMGTTTSEVAASADEWLSV